MAEPGSWQSDPDDPGRLRWRTDAGKWTDYTAAGSEVAAVPIKAGRKRRKWPWIVLAAVVALGVIGGLAEQGENSMTPASRSTVTTTAATASDSDLIAECGRLGERVVLYTTEDIPDAVARFDAAAEREDIAAMQSAYNHIGATIRTLRSTVATMEATGCPGLFPEAWIEVVGGQLEMEVGWGVAQEVCRQDLAPVFDFNC